MVVRRALVVGAETLGLTGVHNDVQAMSSVLADRGFAVDLREGHAATRAGILDGYEKLISESAQGDCAVVHFSGHGALFSSEENRRGPQEDVQSIVPMDFAQSTADDFLGISSLELRVLLARLTANCRNALVVLDCCHAAHMSRDPDMRPRATTHPAHLDVAAHNARRVREGMRIDLLDPVGNPNAVRLVACAPEQTSYEYTNGKGVRIGLMTESFCLALAEAGAQRVTWTALMGRIRRRVELLAPTQRPEVEGPSRRFLFEEEGSDEVGALAVVPLDRSRISLPAARLAGVAVGDEFTVAEPPDERPVLADIAVQGFDGLAAVAGVTFRGAVAAVPVGAVARPSQVAARPWPVRVNGTGATADRLRAAIEADPVLRAVTDDDRDAPVLADVDGEPRPLDLVGALLHHDDRVYVKLRNESNRALFFNVVDLGADSAVTLVLHADRSGLLLDAGEEYVIGLHGDGVLQGVALYWPDGLPAGVPRLETVLVLVSSVREDLTAVCQEGLRGFPPGQPMSRALRTGSTLQRMLAHAAIGGAREIVPERVRASTKYATRRLDFLLSPLERPPAETTRFLVDVRPERSVRLLRPRSGDTATVEIRLTELVLHGQVPGDRVDVVVVVGGADGVPSYRARTIRFDGAPPSGVVLDRGEASGQLDLAVWVTADDGAVAELPELLAARVGPAGLRKMAGRLAGRASAQPWAAAAPACAVASAEIVDIADGLLSTANTRTAIYRTTVLASENFGAGRHPERKLLRAGAFSLAHEISVSRP
ncbi:caspase family protein [Lentzea californiensis]|uniref:caspase family protein n=1 Tax=Lentzea californiensis TaxID=438851 RepID=UPI002164F6CC|nr:caspase family protein [Lentzea californiensis]MCR3750282.1 Caspase domain-containing protein [Lentzea californiensis]